VISPSAQRISWAREQLRREFCALFGEQSQGFAKPRRWLSPPMGKRYSACLGTATSSVPRLSGNGRSLEASLLEDPSRPTYVELRKPLRGGRRASQLTETEKLLFVKGIPPVRSSIPAWTAYKYQELWM
jgi:hypothetical protein